MGEGVTSAEARPCRCRCWGDRSGGVQRHPQRLAGKRKRSIGVNNKGDDIEPECHARTNLGYVDDKFDFDKAGGSFG